MKQFLLYAWQLPQNLLGLLLILILNPEKQFFRGNASVFIASRMRGGISLGRYVIVSRNDRVGVAHELGHCVQSRRLGWIYLLTVGLVSGLRAGLNLYQRGHYYDGWPEDRADRLGGVVRDADGNRILKRP